jgi:hypothetical protein
MIRQSGEEPEIIEYLNAAGAFWVVEPELVIGAYPCATRERLIELLRAIHMRPRELLRERRR